MKNKGANRIHRRKPAKNFKLSQLQQIWYSMDAKCVLDPMAQRKRLMQFIMRNVFGGCSNMRYTDGERIYFVEHNFLIMNGIFFIKRLVEKKNG